jgi:hypothetical protein
MGLYVVQYGPWLQKALAFKVKKKLNSGRGGIDLFLNLELTKDLDYASYYS